MELARLIMNLVSIYSSRKISSNLEFADTREAKEALFQHKYTQEKKKEKRRPFTKMQVKTILESEHCNPETPEGLNNAMMFVYGISCATRKTELQDMIYKHFSIETMDTQEGKQVRFLVYYPLGSDQDSQREAE